MIEKFRIRISQIFAVLLIISICISRSYWEDDLPLLSSALFASGAFLVGLASMGRLWCSIYIAGYKKNHLVKQGPYSMCRNPLYFFSFLGALGVGLASETLIIPLAILIGFVVYYPLVIKAEEAELVRLHKSEFEIYMKEVPRFFPKISLLKEPKEYIVKPIVLRKQMLNALWFIWFLGILEIIEELHKLKAIPTIFKLY
jgi:protein-S-isoprenylcysteine O-methyltransferase Ste14